ncbi:M81 family metallopeptidase [Pararhodobacter sp. SW119]|uniref:M81 family metallopeptidase n=1 Tax=Pararhodobacter sp. SW119 TaxID=2780075 RepID=UPI001ADF1304|nr:M81 family metallopeptidase [Pararhodobacter sp. SW119]
MPRIAIGGFLHETNTFGPSKASYADFDGASGYGPIRHGDEVFAHLSNVNAAIAGAIAEGRARGWEMMPALWCAASPSAQVTEDAFERITGALIDRIAAAIPLDGVFLDLHGAMVTEHLDDGEGEILRRLRDRIGPDVPVAVALDLHANVTPLMFAQADLLESYRTYPHVDMIATGARAATVLAQMIETGRKPEKTFLQAPFLTAISWQSTWTDPARGLYARLAEIAQDVTALSFNMGFPAADFHDCGMSVLAYGPRADGAAHAMMDAVAAAEPDFRGRVYSPADGVAEALRLAAHARRPVVLSDTQDNPGAGANSDTTGMIRAMLAAGAPGAIGNLFDPAAARMVHQAGTGATVRLALGGHSQPGDTPLESEFTVEVLSDGTFPCPGPFYGGRVMQMGPSAALRIGDLRIALTSAKAQMADREMFRALGIPPEEEKIVIVKSSNHFRADFQPISEAVLVCAAPGPMAVNPATLPWRRLRPGLRLEPLGAPFNGDPA